MSTLPDKLKCGKRVFFNMKDKLMHDSNDIKIAIHDRPGSFSGRWVEYCKENHIAFSLVNCYDTGIVKQLKSFDVLLWHWHHQDTKAILFVRQLLRSLENTGIKVFPNIDTCWHFDDKVGQKYLLESIGAPLVPSYVFYGKKDALHWLENTDFPKVFKLRCGAGAKNVRLVRNPGEARKLCKTAFAKGFKADAGYFSDVSTGIRKAKRSKDYLGKIRRMPSIIMNIYLANLRRGREKGYVYFQDFIENNKYDTRITVVGNRAFAFRRMTRKNDFRASGSGQIDYDISEINKDCLAVAFEVAKKLKLQSVAFDFVEGKDSAPLIVEISYGYVPSAIKNCPGHWDEDLNWHKGAMWPQDAIIEDVIAGNK